MTNQLAAAVLFQALKDYEMFRQSGGSLTDRGTRWDLEEDGPLPMTWIFSDDPEYRATRRHWCALAMITEAWLQRAARRIARGEYSACKLESLVTTVVRREYDEEEEAA